MKNIKGNSYSSFYLIPIAFLIGCSANNLDGIEEGTYFGKMTDIDSS